MQRVDCCTTAARILVYRWEWCKDASHGVSFALNRGEVCALLGENGSGKTTLLRAAYTLYRNCFALAN